MNLNLHPHVWVLALAMLFAGTSAFANRTRTAAKDSLVTAAKDSTDAKKKEQKKLTPYERLFDGKTVVSAKGKFANLYLIDKKVYLEYPVAELGKELMLSTTIAATSEPTILTVGKTNTEPLHFRFAMEDSAIVMKSVNAVLVNPYNQAYEQSVSALHYAGASMAKFNIEAFNKDSSAVVINLSPFVTASNSMIPIVPKIVDPYVVTPQPKNELNYVKQLKAFDTNCTVRTEMNYLLNATLSGVLTVASNLPVSAEVNFTLSRQPESRMLPRIADSRLGIAYNRKLKLPDYAEGIQAQYWTQRWNLVPADKAAYLAGKKSRPVRPITLYFDRDFPADWKQAVREGILEWNKAFEAAGFLGAIEVKDYPTTRKDFDIDNYTVSSIRYSPSIGQTVQGSFGANPSTGEITHATLIVSNNIGQLIAQQKFVLTAAADESARRAEPTTENIHAALRYLVMRETGRILGFLDNYAASSAYDVESLRSAKFTREHGLAPSVMDETEFNYVAQPGDKGVLFTPATLGEYDYFLVKWNYTYFGDDRAAADKQLHTLEKWMDKKADDPRYRFSGLNNVDPRALAGDLGDDPIRAAGYGVANLQRIMKHLTKWVKDDEDTRKKDPIYLQMAQQYHKYLKNVLALIGGVYLNQTKEGASTPRYRVVDTDTQRKALEWSYNYVAHFTDFAGRDFERKDFFSIGYFDQLIEYVTNDFFARRRNVLQSSYMTPGSYSQREYYYDVYRLLFGGIDTDRRPNHTEMFMQHLYLAIAKGLVRGSINDAQAEQGAPSGKASLYLEMVKKFGEVPPQYLPALDGNGFGDPSSPLLPNVNLKPFDRAAVILCDLLPRLQKDLETRLETEKDSDLRAHFSMILHKVKDILDETSK